MRLLQVAILLGGIEAGAGLATVEVAVTADAGLGVSLLEVVEQQAQAFTIRQSGLELTSTTYGKPALRREPHSGSHRKPPIPLSYICSFCFSEVPIRLAIEQIKMYECIRCTGQNYEISRKPPKKFWTFCTKNVFECTTLHSLKRVLELTPKSSKESKDSGS